MSYVPPNWPRGPHGRPHPWLWLPRSERLRLGAGSITSEGYLRLSGLHEHPSATESGTLYEHRAVAERKLGRLLRPDEVVHHINGDRLDNRPENLHVCSSHAEHRLLHRSAA